MQFILHEPAAAEALYFRHFGTEGKIKKVKKGKGK